MENSEVDFKIIMLCKYYVDDYHKITLDEFTNQFKARDILNWRSFGLKRLNQLAEVLDKVDLKLNY